MRQKNETDTSFNQLKEITQIMQVQKGRLKTSEITTQSTLTPKARARAKNHALKPTKRAFSERQITTIRDNSQASANKSQENKQGDNANAFKGDEANHKGGSDE